ncbi:MAG: hypothetical protein JWO81_2283 [Alphaproteobacteria bacterium]|nr:hypothetical protein [Alphaproteobacteria bacterium]
MSFASRLLVAALALLAGCSSKQDAALEAVKGAHSVTAEWAATERLAERSRVTQTYRGEIREMAKDQLQSQGRILRQSNDPAARTIDAIRADAAPSAAALAAAAKTLDESEKRLEAH